MSSLRCSPKRTALRHACSTSRAYHRRRWPTSLLGGWASEAESKAAWTLLDLQCARAGEHAGAVGFGAGFADRADRRAGRHFDIDEADLARRHRNRGGIHV